MSNGELYTIVANKAAKGKRGFLVAIIKGTKRQEVVAVFEEDTGKVAPEG